MDYLFVAIGMLSGLLLLGGMACHHRLAVRCGLFLFTLYAIGVFTVLR